MSSLLLKGDAPRTHEALAHSSWPAQLNRTCLWTLLRNSELIAAKCKCLSRTAPRKPVMRSVLGRPRVAERQHVAFEKLGFGAADKVPRSGPALVNRDVACTYGCTADSPESRGTLIALEVADQPYSVLNRRDQVLSAERMETCSQHRT
jgi:hypothetical protein